MGAELSCIEQFSHFRSFPLHVYGGGFLCLVKKNFKIN